MTDLISQEQLEKEYIEELDMWFSFIDGPITIETWTHEYKLISLIPPQPTDHYY